MTRVRTGLGPGVPPALQYGAIPRPDGVEFVLFSRHAEHVSVLLFSPDDEEPTEEIRLSVEHNRRGDLWYVFVPGLREGQLYAFRVEGPTGLDDGHRFDPPAMLLDPYAKAVTTNQPRFRDGEGLVHATGWRRARCVVLGDRFDWQDVEPPRHRLADTVIYELHARGFTAHPSSGVRFPGTFLALIEKIPYLRDLGVTAVELLPVQEFDHREVNAANPMTGERLSNYWGYSPLAFFAPNGRYAHGVELGAQVTEFKTMVREFHRAGIEIILDVVFNHTGEGNELGPILSFKGIDNSIYYFLKEDGRSYLDFSGCGNSINSNHPVVREMILTCLRYWVRQMQVDGFRFDLASVLSRDRAGRLMSDPPLLEAIAEDPVLRDTKIIAEAWDAAGAYQVGSFPGGRWAEWNGRFRDEVRQFWRGDEGRSGALATRLCGSSDLYQHSGRRPNHSINFITSHDGFTLNDLVTYNLKHNLANGEENRDGENNNYSYNHGVEGPSDNSEIERLRIRQIKNMLATLLLSRGTPMLLGGDEVRRTQRGNNNAYCQDNEISWFDWALLETSSEILRFTRFLIRYRLAHRLFRRSTFLTGAAAPGAPVADVIWYQPRGAPMDWNHDDGAIMCFLDGRPAQGSLEDSDDQALLLFNASSHPRTFTLAEADRPQRPWRLVLDTGMTAPLDIFPDDDGPLFATNSPYPTISKSMALLRRPLSDD